MNNLIKLLGLPIPPQLVRAEKPCSEKFLSKEAVSFGYALEGALIEPVLQTLRGCGAQLSDAGSAANPYALIFDASGIDCPDGLRMLYDFFHPRLPGLANGGRVVLLTRPHTFSVDPAAAAASRAVEGFCRSLARELGHRGVTVQLIAVEPAAEARLEGPLRFLLSRHSTFVNGQLLYVSNRARAPAAPVRWEQPLQHKVALVTGAARGIGRAVSSILAREGATVVGLDKAEGWGSGDMALSLDLGVPGASDAIAEFIYKKYGGVDILVHNAGITRDRTLRRMPASDWDTILGVNLAAVVRIDQALLQNDLLRDEGRIVCLSSITGIGGNAGQTAYAASKAGLIGYVAALADQLAFRGITVNAVAPGFIETRMTAAIPFLLRQMARRLNSFTQGGLPGDVAEVVAFLASPGAVGLSGATLRVCGQNLMGA